jgi:hypothetical protein
VTEDEALRGASTQALLDELVVRRLNKEERKQLLGMPQRWLIEELQRRLDIVDDGLLGPHTLRAVRKELDHLELKHALAHSVEDLRSRASKPQPSDPDDKSMFEL